MKVDFELVSDFSPSGDQPEAIATLSKNVINHVHNQVLLGVTGSGKTFTIANVINTVKRPTLIMTHNKTLAAQLYREMRAFFPNNAVEYFVSYYDYYQPEAYIAHSDTYIEKESSINEEIDRMRNSATRSLLERQDVIVVASVSCIYGLGPIESYSNVVIDLKVGDIIKQQFLARKLADIQYQRNDFDFRRGCFKSNGDIVDIFPSHLSDKYWRVCFFGNEIECIWEISFPENKKIQKISHIRVYSNSHYVTTNEILTKAISEIKDDLHTRLQEFNNNNKIIEKQRLEQRVLYDIEMMQSTGSCAGIENYSRYISGRLPGEPPPTLFEYLPQNALLIVDESHVTVPQIKGMFLGDAARKKNLSDYGFRLPSCMDNRPLKFEEWDSMRPDTIFMSATPSEFELEQSGTHIVEQLIRPTGILDPRCEIRPCDNQIDNLIEEINKTKDKGFRTLVTTLTKKMAEMLTEYLSENGISVAYMHSDTDTLDRIEIIKNLKNGEFDVLVGINLLREGLDIPECAFVAILDADKEGFLRSRTSLVQTIGRAARNPESLVVLYADTVTKSIEQAIAETNRRREFQEKFNTEHGIVPKAIVKMQKHKNSQQNENISIAELEKKMEEAASNLQFEEAAMYRDQIKKLSKEINF